MVRILGTIFAGIVIAVALVAGIGMIGMKSGPGTPSPGGTTDVAKNDAGAANAPADPVEQTPPQPEPVAQKMPPPFYMWKDGYPADPDPSVWSRRHQLALSAYLSDWNLPPEEPNREGQLSPALEAHITRQHPDRAPKFMRLANQQCQVWIANPLAQEQVEWDGACKDGLADGEGVLVRTYVNMGEIYEIGYAGPMVAGKANGVGKTLDSKFLLYEGEHVDGLYHGQGALTDVAYDGVDTYQGSFAHGYPHGQGRRDWDGRISEGEWNSGCFSDSTSSTWVLRHSTECPSRRGGSILGRLLD